MTLYPKQNILNFQSPTKHCKKVNVKKCKLLCVLNTFVYIYTQLRCFNKEVNLWKNFINFPPENPRVFRPWDECRL